MNLWRRSLKDKKGTLQQFKPAYPQDAFLFPAQPPKKPGNKVAQIQPTFLFTFLD